MPPLGLGGLFLMGLALLSMGLGRCLLRRLRPAPSHPLERACIAAGLGLGLVQAVSFLLFAIGIGTPWAFRLIVGALAVVGLSDCVAVLRAGWRWIHSIRNVACWQKIVFSTFVLLLIAIFFRAVLPVTDDDGLRYHLTAARKFVDAGRFVYLPTLTMTNWPLGVETLFSVVYAIYTDAPVCIVSFYFGVLCLVGVYILGRRIGGSLAGAVALLLLLLYRAFWWEMATAYIDLGMTAYMLLSVLALILSHETGEDRWWAISAVFAGLAATCKLTGLWVILAVMLTYLSLRPPQVLLRKMALFGLIAGCIVAPWFLKTWALTGNPVYPMLYSLFDGREWTSDGWPRLRRFYLILNTPPGYPPTPGVLAVTHAVIGAAGILIALLTWRFSRPGLTGITSRAAAFFTAWVCLSSYFHLRFLLPAIPLVAVSLSGLLTRRPRPCVHAVVCVAVILMAARTAWRVPEPDLPTAFEVAVGVRSKDDYLRVRIRDYAVTEYANRQLPADSRILLVKWDLFTAYYQASALWADCWAQDSIHYDSPSRLLTDLRRLGVTHLVIQPDYPDWCGRSYMCRERRQTEPEALDYVAKRYGRLLIEANGCSLYSLTLSETKTVW